MDESEGFDDDSWCEGSFRDFAFGFKEVDDGDFVALDEKPFRDVEANAATVS